MQLEISKIVVLRGDHGPDKIMVTAPNLKPTVWPFNEPAVLRFEVARGNGVKYVRENFGVEPEFLDISVEQNQDGGVIG